MRFQHSAAGLAALLATSAQAHTLLTTVFVNDVNMGDSNFIRFPRNIDLGKATYPIEDLTSTDMACGRSGDTPAAYTMPITAGSKLTFEFRGDPDGAQPGGKGIEAGHKGSAAVYLKQVASPSDKASGGGWFKLWEEGHDDKSGKWGTDKFRDANGLLSVSLPTSLPSGYYLARAELLALQDVQQGGAQFFVGCAQLFVSGSGSGTLQIPAGSEAQIPGYVKKGDPAVSFVLEQSRFPYKTAGPAPWAPPAAAGSGPATTNNVVLKQDEGLVPDNCILQAGGFCGLEPATYSSAAGREKAAAECTRGVDTCNKQNLPTGDKNCAVWEKYCASIQRGGTSGPPNAGKKLTPSNIDVPGPIPPAVNGGGGSGGSSSSSSSSSAAAPASNAQSAGGSTAAAAPAPAGAPPSSKSSSGAAAPAPAAPSPADAGTHAPASAAADKPANQPADKPASQSGDKPAAASPGQGDGAKAGGAVTPAAPQVPAPTGGFAANHPATGADDCDEEETEGAKSIQGGEQEDSEDEEDDDDKDDEDDEGDDEDGDDEEDKGAKGGKGAGKYKGDQRKGLASKGEEETPVGKPTLNVGEKDDEEDGADEEDGEDEEDDEEESDDDDDDDDDDEEEEEAPRGGKKGGFPFGGKGSGAGKGAAAAPAPGYPVGKPNKVAARAVTLVGRGEACGGESAQACESSCCGAHGVCGSSKLHCGQGCQSLFGLCA